MFQLKYARAAQCDRTIMGIMKNALSIHYTPPWLLPRGDIIFKVIVITQKVFNWHYISLGLSIKYNDL